MEKQHKKISKNHQGFKDLRGAGIVLEKWLKIMKQNIIMNFHADPDFFVILNKKNANPNFSNMITEKQKIPKLCIPLKVCQIGFPSSYFVQVGIWINAKRKSKIKLTPTAAKDYNMTKCLQCVGREDCTFVAKGSRRRKW